MKFLVAAWLWSAWMVWIISREMLNLRREDVDAVLAQIKSGDGDGAEVAAEMVKARTMQVVMMFLGPITLICFFLYCIYILTKSIMFEISEKIDRWMLLIRVARGDGREVE